MGQSRRRGRSSDGDYQTPMDSVGETVRSLGAEEQLPHISGAQTNAGCECLPLCHLWFPWTAAHQASLSITISWSSLKPMSVESVMPSNRLTLCRHLLLPPSVFPGIGSFQMSRLLALCALKSLNFLTHGMQIPETSVPARKISDG